MMQDVPAAPKEDAITIFMDITIDLPAEIAEQLELLGICVFETSRGYPAHDGKRGDHALSEGNVIG